MSNNNSIGFSIFGTVFVVLFTLKLAEIGAVASLSWWWVTAPLWVPMLIPLSIIVVGSISLVRRRAAIKRRLRELN